MVCNQIFAYAVGLPFPLLYTVIHFTSAPNLLQRVFKLTGQTQGGMGPSEGKGILFSQKCLFTQCQREL